MLKLFGILAWGGCLVTLVYQGIYWVIQNSWPSLTLLDILRNLFGLDLLTAVGKLPLDVAAKALYVAFTTELSLFLWWTGVAMFGLLFLLGILKRN